MICLYIFHIVVGTCEDNIKMYLEVTGWEDVAWIHLAQDRDKWSLVYMVMTLFKEDFAKWSYLYIFDTHFSCL